MFTQDFSAWSSKGREMFEPFSQIQKFNSDALEQITRENLSFFSDGMASCVRGMQLMNKINRPEDFMKAQMSLMASQGERWLEYSQNLLKICEDNLKNYRGWVDGKITSAFQETEKMQKDMQRETRGQH